MSYSPTEIEARLWGLIPNGLIEATMRTLADANREAKKSLVSFEKPEHRDIFGHLQRAHLEGLWRKAIKPIEGVRVRTQMNKRGTSRFTVARMDGLVLTASAVKEPSLLPRFASFRNRFASQMELFAADDRRQSSGGLIYAIVTHSTNSDFDLYDAALVLPNERGTGAFLRLSLAEELRAALELSSEEAAEEKIPEPQLPNIAAMIAARKKTGA